MYQKLSSDSTSFIGTSRLIYPPATGKLTIATELAVLTGYTLFHNHLSLNLAREIFPDFDDKPLDLVHEI